MKERSIWRALMWMAFALQACSCLLASGRQDNASFPTGEHEDGGGTITQRLFSEGPESYQGIPYFWTARFSLHLTIPTRPKSSHRLEFLWGSKNDRREAKVEVNGILVLMSAGGYDGFRWQEVTLPPSVAGKQYEVKVSAGPGNAAFLAGVRLRDLQRAGVSPPPTEVTDPLAINVKVLPPGDSTVFATWKAFWGRPSGRKVLGSSEDQAGEELFYRAEHHARQAHEQFFRCRKYLEGWLRHADPRTGLIPENLRPQGATWTPENAAADNYPFLVLSAALVAPELFQGPLRAMLDTERKLTSRLDRLPDAWSLTQQTFLRKELDLERLLFGASEYVKDGLLPLTEWLGPSPWSERLIEILDDIWKHAPVETPFGPIPSTNVEVNGEQLQTLCRIYWMTGEPKYLEWAMRLGDFYLLGDRHPTRHFPRLRLRDHGCEIVSGLSELYVAVHFAAPDKKPRYREAIYAMFDRILEVGRDERGMLYNWINPITGEHDPGICDTWGYIYNGIYAVWMMDGHQPYRHAVRQVLSRLPRLVDYHWGVADEYADSIEGALNLFNREPVPEAAAWIDSEIHDMWRPQEDSGIIEGWHGDGNVARTAIMYALWKTQGVTLQPWREDLLVGAVQKDGRLYLVLSAGENPWTGRVCFDRPRHIEQMRLPIDYPRINQFPEWFVARADRKYIVRQLDRGSSSVYLGHTLQAGLTVTIPAGCEIRWIIEEAH